MVHDPTAQNTWEEPLKRAVVTGGAGFLGSHLSDALLARGWDVLCVDNLITGQEANIAHLMEHSQSEAKSSSRFRTMRHDVSTYIDVPGPVAAVLHFASPASPVDYLKHPIPTLKVGSLGTHNALGLAMAKGARFLLASTSECYGDPEVSPQPETYWGHVNQVGPRGVYDEAKRFAEAITMAYHRYHGLDTKIVRIFNTYGPRMRLNDGRALPNFLYQALTGQPITVYGDGRQTRSFCYVSDLIEGICRLLESDEHLPTNIGNPQEITILEFAERIIALTGAKVPLVFKPLPQDDPKQRCPDITKAKRILQWEPKVGLEEGLHLTHEYFRQQVAAS
jgi:dTDP-glucose 4,6-dehydratase